MDFVPYASIKRGLDFGFMTITEKIDGTNAQFTILDKKVVGVGSHHHSLDLNGRPEGHFGFVGWVQSHKEEIEAKLNDGTYYGEWYGLGINKNRYNLQTKRFAFFKAHYWRDPQRPRISDIDIVPILYIGTIKTEEVDRAMERLAKEGSVLVPGCMNPEGVVIELPKLGVLRKQTFNGNKHKGEL